MGEGRASQLLGLTTMGYFDLEAYEDEWRIGCPPLHYHVRLQAL